MAINGTIKEVNLNPSGTSLRDVMVTDQPSLICIFEQIFGHNKPPTFESHGSAEHVGQGNSKVIRMMSSKTSQVNKSMQLTANYSSAGNPLKMIKEYKTGRQSNKGSISFKSNASTKEFQQEELQRFNKIMNDPLENLISNVHEYQ